MHIVVIGNDAAFAECRAKFGEDHQYQHDNVFSIKHGQVDQGMVIFDFNADWTKEKLTIYDTVQPVPVFINTVFTTLSEILLMRNLPSTVFGFCGLPSFFNRSVLEITVANPTGAEILTKVSGTLNTEFKIVKDQVGMVTPRVIAMIINEAYEALQQGVASREDIDLSMKLGTNYPYGPFEWGDRIGLENVRKLLKALEKATGDNRYHSNL